MKNNLNYRALLKNPEIVNIYTSIDLKQKNDILYFIADHGMLHIKRVLKNIKKICRIVDINSDIRGDLYIAGILHDVGMLDGKVDHNKRSALFATNLLKNYHYTKNIDQVVSAIMNHSDCVSDDNIISIILTLADKLDITYSRVGFAGVKMQGMRQLLNIHKIVVKRCDKNIQFIFYVNNYFNINEFKEFYFFNKLIVAICNFCCYFNLEYEIFLRRRRYDRGKFLVKTI